MQPLSLTGRPDLRYSPPPGARPAPAAQSPVPQDLVDLRAEASPAPRTWAAVLSVGALAALSLIGPAAHAAAPELPAVAQSQGQLAPGTLVLTDYFESKMPDNPPHGQQVEESARKQGFQGPIVRREAPENAEILKSRRLTTYLDQRQYEPAEMRQLVRDYAVQSQVGPLKSATQELDAIRQGGLRNGAVNLSRGSGEAQVVEALYGRLQEAWSPTASFDQTKAIRRLDKVAPAYGLDAAQVRTNPAERAKLQQALIDEVDAASAESPELKAAQADYERAVRELEANHNSVVVAAANSGELLEHMAQDAGGVTPHVSGDFWRNRLASDATTMVGGMSGERIGAYTNPDPGMDLYADGDVKQGDRLVNWGTSFATPRVSATMAEIHRRNPGMTSAEVEALLTRDLPTAAREGYAPAPRLAEGYLLGPQ